MRFSERSADRTRFEALAADIAALRSDPEWGRPVALQRDRCMSETITLSRQAGWVELAADAADYASWASDSATLRERLAHAVALEMAYLEGATPDPHYAIQGETWNVTRFAETRRQSNDQRVQELMARAIRDQVARVITMGESSAPFTAGLSDNAKEHWPLIVTSELAEIDCNNTAWLREQVRAHGWFDRSRYGAEADEAAWLMVQHADRTPAFQGEMLPLLEELAAAGESSRQLVAYLWDRVAVKEGRPQRYGTQMECAAGETRPIGGLEDAAHVEERRAAIGMMTYATYLQMMDRMYDACPA